MNSIVSITFVFLLCITTSYGQKQMPVHEAIEWTNVWIPHADKNDLPRVLLIGNSITQGYYPVVEKILDGSAYTARFTTSSSVADPVFFDELKVYLQNYRFAVIQFNNGLHGIGSDSVHYEEGIRKLIKILKKYGNGAKLLAATTTLVMPGFEYWKTDEFNLRLVEERNRVLRELCTKNDIPVNDLFFLTKDHPEWFSDDKIHYNQTGYDELGKQSAEAINSLLKKQ